MISVKISTLAEDWQSLKLNWWEINLIIDIEDVREEEITNHVSLMRTIVYGVDAFNATALIRKRRGQMILHSYIYYHSVDFPIISDEKWQEWANDLVDLQSKYDKIIGFYDNEFSDWTGDTGCHLPTPITFKQLAFSLMRYKP
jgi:hypothetical protein